MFDFVQKRRFRTFNKLQVASYVVTGFFICLILGILILGFLFIWYAKDLPHPDKIRRVEGFSTVISDRNEQVIYDIYQDENRIPLTIDQIPRSLQQATIAIEDKDFYQHQGFSKMGMLRAILKIFFLGRLEGGSTLTQQLVKNVLLTQERTLPRKLKEFILAVQIERKYSKDEILQMYLNETPYGGTAYGVETASAYYFDKHATDLTLTESIILAGLPASPSLYSPFTSEDPKAYIWRSEQVARRMREDGVITSDQEKQIKVELLNVVFTQGETGLVAPHFVAYVKDLLIEKFGENLVELGGLKVTTTLDLDLQKSAEKIVKEEVDKLKNLKVSNGAALALNPSNGEIIAMVGSKDYEASESGGYKFNVVTQGLRQPGSALKPITYAAALAHGYTPSSIVMDVETKFPGGAGEKDYAPKNYDGKFRGPVQLRYALANSINVSAVKLLALVGIKDMLEIAYRMGLTTLAPTTENVNRFGLSVTLGGGEVKLIDLTSSFGVLTTGGMKQDTVSILKVTDQKGKTLFEHKTLKGKKVLDEDVSYLITNILSDNVSRKEIFGEKSYLVIPGYTVAVKTGTTDDKRDNWTVGGTPSVVVGVWVGNNDNMPMHSSLASGVTGAAPIWNRIIKAGLKGKIDESFARPSSIIEMEIDSFGGGLPREDKPKRKEIFIKGTEPTSVSPVYKKLKVSKSDSTKLANLVEIASGSFDEKEFYVFSETDPISTDGKNRWQEGIDEWLKTKSESEYHPPTEVSSGKLDEVVVNIVEPSDGKRFDDHDVKVKVGATSLGTIKKLIIYIDDTEYKTFNQSSFTETINFSSGVHEIKVRGEDDRGKSAEGKVKIGINTDVK